MADTLNDAATDPRQTIADLQRKLAECAAERDQLLQQRTATADVLKVISRSAFDLPTVLDTLMRTAAELCGVESGGLTVRDGDVFRYTAFYGLSEEYRAVLRARPVLPGRETVAGRVILEKRVVQVADLATDPDYAVPESVRVAGIRTTLIVPLLRDGEVVGTLGVNRHRVAPFTERQIELLRTFADQAVIAIENARLFNETRDALERQTATSDVLQAISGSMADSAPVFERILDSCEKLLRFTSAAIVLIDGDQQLLQTVRGPGTRILKSFFPQPLDATLEKAFRNRRPLYTANFAESAMTTSTLRLAAQKVGGYALLQVPMFWQGRGIGAIYVSRLPNEGFSDKEVALLQTFADQAVIAVQNTRLFNETKEALERQTATSDILNVIASSPTDTQPVFDAIARLAGELCEGTNSAVFELRDGLVHLVGYHNLSPEQLALAPKAFPAPPHRGYLAGRAIVDRAVAHVADIAADPEYSAQSMVKAGFRSAVSVPMFRSGEPIGAINVTREEARPFSARQIELLKTFADQAVIAIENARLFNETQEALQQQKASADILSVISNSVADPKPVFDKILRSIEHLFGADERFVFLVGDDGLLHIGAVHGPNAERAHALFPVPLQGSVSEVAIRERRLVKLADVFNDPDVPPVLREVAHRFGKNYSMVVAPMLWEDRAIGSIFVGRTSMELFSEKECDLLRTFADQAVIAIQNARLFEQVQTKSRNLEESLQQQTATADVLKIISRSVAHAAPVFDTILESCQRLFDPYDAAVYLVEGDRVRGVAQRGAGAGDWGTDSMPLEGSSTGAAIAQRQPLHFPDLADKASLPEDKRAVLKQTGGMTVLYAPMISQDRGVGSLVVTRRPKKPFTRTEIDLIQTFADQAVIAIENARLFDEVQARTRDLGEALEQQTATADVLKIISRSAFDLQAVLDTLTTSAVNLLGMRSGTICVRDGSVFRYRSAAGAFWTEELWRYLQDHPVVPGRSTAAGRAIMSGHIEQIPDILDDAEYGIPMQALTSEQFPRAMLSVPLLGKDKIEGAMVLSRQDPGPFTQREVDILQTFADQAVIAIDNTRLFNETREALERQTATADILKVIASSPSNAQPVFEAIASSANRLIGGFSTAVHLIVDDMVHLVAFTPTNPEADAILVAAHPRHRSEVPAVALVENGEIAQIADSETADAHIRQLGRARGWRSVTLTPLMNRRNFIGFIASTRRETGVLGNHQVELLRTFSDQAVIAIENARLFNELQARTRDLSKSLDDLRTAQDRLVQTEKLASLGQLTAGIAHEIKNPLNFINNFAALSVELTDELLDVLKPAPLDAMMRGDVDELTHMLKGNLDKVTQHGRRADSIVKNMLLHSREGTGERRPADINALVEESLNLAYHGARAEKPGFNITLQRAFDPAAGEIDMFPQEITRVLLNLITNGFYATAKRKAEAGDGFEPVLSAATKTLGDRVEIRIRDNGTGIPREVREKIFNPFFTTKPAGEGTGLGLSMSHDIIVKQHGGTIDVETAPGQFTEFIVTLPRAGAAAPETGGLK